MQSMWRHLAIGLRRDLGFCCFYAEEQRLEAERVERLSAEAVAVAQANANAVLAAAKKAEEAQMVNMAT